jgi:hypothetical protein
MAIWDPKLRVRRTPRAGGEGRHGRAAEGVVVAPGNCAAAHVGVFQGRQLCAEDRRLELVEPRIPAFHLGAVAGRPAVLADAPEALRDRGVVGRHRAPVAVGSEVLGRIEGEGGREPDRAGRPSAERGPVALRAVLEQHQAARAGELRQPFDVRDAAVEVHGQEEAGPRRDRARGEGGIHRQRCGIDVAEPQIRPGEADAGGHGTAGSATAMRAAAAAGRPLRTRSVP